jgi:hypothetical protein
MDWLRFISSVIKSFAWPVVVVVIVVFVRKPLCRALENYQRLKVRYKDLEFGLERDVQELVTSANAVVREVPKSIENTEIENKRLQLAELSPRGAILETWLDFEEFLRTVCLSKGIEITRAGGLPSRVIPLESSEMASKLLEAEVLGPKAKNVIEQLRKVRNQAVHLVEPAITYENAKFYIEAATGIKSAIDDSVNNSQGTA